MELKSFEEYYNERLEEIQEGVSKQKINKINSFERDNTDFYKDIKVLEYILSNFKWEITNSDGADRRFHEIEIDGLGVLTPERNAQQYVIKTDIPFSIKLTNFWMPNTNPDKGDFVEKWTDKLKITNKKKISLAKWFMNSSMY